MVLRRMSWCLGTILLIFIAHSFAAPTQDTLVVARSDDAEASSTQSTDIETTEAPLPPIKLLEIDVRSEITLRYANSAVVTKVRNPAQRSQEATFSVLLPDTAFISGFVMVLDGKPYKAYVKEKEEAKKIYNEAVSQGLGAAHVAAKARDSNHFTVSVNIEPNTEAVFNLTYEELLERRNGVYNHAINLHPGGLVPKLTVTVHIKEGNKLTALRVPEIRTGNEIDATEEDAPNTKVKIDKSEDERSATIIFTPDLEEQKKLMDVYTEKTRESRARSERRWYEAQENNQEIEGVLGQFVVQYDVERSNDGEVLVNDGYFVHFFAPPSLPPLNKHIIFVLDTSGSMMDRKIAQLRDAMRSILSELNAGDYFNIIEFASDVVVHDLKEANGKAEDDQRRTHYAYYQRSRKPTLVPPSPATKENIEKAKIIVGRLDAAGGTNIGQALTTAIELINKGIGWTPNPQTNNTEKEELPETTETTQVTETTQKVDDETQKLEPIIFFLTDGEPTVGETDPRRIITNLSEKSYGDNKAAIFSLAFGEDADRTFLRKLSLLNEGFMRHIYEAADAELQLRHFYKQVSSPLLADVRFVYPPGQVVEGTVTKHKFRTFYAGSETVVAGRIADTEMEFAPEVIGICGVEDGDSRKIFKVSTKVKKTTEYLPLERLWAYLTIKQLLDDKDVTEESTKPEDEKKEDKPEKRALKLALQYEFVTPLTSLVVVKPNATKAVDAESVDKLSPPPAFGYQGVALSAPGFLPAAAPGLPGPPAGAYAFITSRSQAQQLYSIQPIAPLYSITQAKGLAASNLDLIDLRTDLERLPTSDSLDLVVTGENSGGSAIASNVLSTTIPARPQPEPTTANPLSAYGLESYPWTSSLIDENGDTLVLQVNETTVSLKLCRGECEEAAVKEGAGDECGLAIDGENGECKYLTQCDAARDITSKLYETTYCSRNGYAGVCCPKPKEMQKGDHGTQ